MSKIKTLLAFVALTLCGGAWAEIPTPVAHWTSLSEGAKGGEEGTDGAKFTLTAGTGCAFENGVAKITKTSSDDNTGLLLNWEDGAISDMLTIVVRYSGYSTDNGYNSLLAVNWGSYEIVAYANGAGSNVGLSANVASNAGGTQQMSSPAYAMPQAGYIMMTSGTRSNYGTGLAFKPDGASLFKEVKYDSGYRYSAGMKHIKIGGTIAGHTKYYRPSLTIEEVTVYTAKVTAADINADIMANFPEVSFTKANDTDWESKTMPTKANTASVTANTSFVGNGDYVQTLGGKESTVVNVTSASGNIIYGLHAMNGSQNGLGNATRDIYLMASGGTFNAITGGEDATYNATKTVLTGDTLVNVCGDTVVDYVYGAGMGGGSNVTTTGDTGVVIEGSAQVKGTVAGGWQSRHDSYPKVTGNTTVLVKNVQTYDSSAATSTGNHTVDKGLIVGGSIYWGNGGAGTIEGNSAVVVDIPAETEAATFAKKIVGGSYHKNDRKEMTVKGNSSVTITAPNTVTFNQEIIGGGHSTGSQSKVEGNSSVTINGGTYTSNIYAGGNHNAAPVSGTATLTINNGVFSGASLKGGTATGKRILNLNCDQTFAWVSIADFDEVAVAQDKTLKLSVTNAQREFTPAMTGEGVMEKIANGQLTVTAGKEGKITLKEGTLCIKLTVEQQVAGYTSQVTIEGGTLKFVDTTGAELTNGSSDPTVYEMPKNAWNGSAEDGNWDNESNWSYGTVPTASQIIAIESPVTINVTSASVCQQLVVNADAKLVGQIGEGAMPNIIIANEKTLTIEATGESTLNGVSGGKLVKDGSATLNLKAGTGADVSVLANMEVVIKNGKILINQPTGTEAQFHDVAFTIEDSACGDDKVPLDCYGWFSATGPWSITTEGTAKVFNNNGYGNTAVVKGSGAFTKLGAGTVVFCSSLGNAGNVYTGTVAVGAGTLTLNPRTQEDRVSTVSGRLTVAESAILNIEAGATFSNNGSTDTADIRGIVNVNGGTTTIKGSDRGFCGTLNVAKNATMKVDRSDFFTYNGGAVTVNVKGTLDFQTNRQTLRKAVKFNFYSGCTVQGYGDNNQNWPCAMEFWNADHTNNIKFLKADDDATGVVTFNTTVGLENSVTFDIADGVTVVCGPATSGDNTRNLVNRAANDKTITKAGAGILKITTAYTTSTVLAAGTLQVATAADMPTVTKSDANKKVSEDTTTLADYTTYTLVQRDATTVYATQGFGSYKLDENTEVTLVDGDTIVCNSTYMGSNNWGGGKNPSDLANKNHTIIIEHEMDFGGSVGIPAGVSVTVNYRDANKGVYLYGNIAAGSTVNGNGLLYLGHKQNVAGNTEIGAGTSINCQVGFQNSNTATISGAVVFVGDVAVSHAGCLILADNAELTVVKELDAGTVVSGVASKQVKFDSTTKTYSLYTPVAKIVVGDVTTYFETVQAAIDAAGDEHLDTITILDEQAEIPGDYKVVDGVLVKKVYVAQVYFPEEGEESLEKFETFEGAFCYASGHVSLLADVELADTFETGVMYRGEFVPFQCAIDLNGHALTVAGDGKAVLSIPEGAEVQIEGTNGGTIGVIRNAGTLYVAGGTVAEIVTLPVIANADGDNMSYVQILDSYSGANVPVTVEWDPNKLNPYVVVNMTNQHLALRMAQYLVFDEVLYKASSQGYGMSDGVHGVYVVGNITKMVPWSATGANATVTPSVGLTTVSDVQYASVGTAVNFMVGATDGYTISAVTVNGATAEPSEGVYSYTPTADDTEVAVAVTTAVAQKTLTIPAVENTTVTVSVNGGAAVTNPGSITVDLGAKVVVTWTPNEGWLGEVASDTIDAVAAGSSVTAPEMSLTKLIPFRKNEIHSEMTDVSGLTEQGGKDWIKVGDTLSFKASADTGYEVKVVIVGNGRVDPNASGVYSVPATAGMTEIFVTVVAEAAATAGVSQNALHQPVITFDNATPDASYTVVVHLADGKTHRYTGTTTAKGGASVTVTDTIAANTAYTYEINVTNPGTAEVVTTHGSFYSGDSAAWFQADPAKTPAMVNADEEKTTLTLAEGGETYQLDGNARFEINDKTPVAGKVAVVEQTITFTSAIDVKDLPLPTSTELNDASGAITLAQDDGKFVWQCLESGKWVTMAGTGESLVPTKLPAECILRFEYDAAAKTVAYFVNGSQLGQGSSTAGATMNGVSFIGQGSLTKLVGTVETKAATATVAPVKPQGVTNPVTVDPSFVIAVAGSGVNTPDDIQTAITQPVKEGSDLTVWQAYAMGLDAEAAKTATFTVSGKETGDANTLKLVDGLTPRVESGVTVTRKVKTAPTPAGLDDATATDPVSSDAEGVTIALPTTGDKVKYFKIEYSFK